MSLSDNDLWGLPEMDTSNSGVLLPEDAIKSWAAAMPQLYQTQLEYAPKEAALQLGLTQQYAFPYAQALKSAQEKLYPNETALANTLTQQAREGINGMPSWAKQQYISDYNANLGSNAGSPIGADYVSRGLLDQNEGWKKYYQNLALSIGGKQPTYQAQPTGYSNYMGSFNPTAVYGTQAQALSNNYSTNMNAYNNYVKTLGQIYGSAIGAAGSAMAAGG